MNIVKPSRVRALENNLGALRLFAALLVIYGHGQDMKGQATPLLWNTPVSGIGLDIFFSLSGYLIHDSWLRDPRLLPFLAKRALRIFPGLIVCVLVCAFVIGPLATSLQLGQYFSQHGTWQFLLNIALYLKLYLPGVFGGRLLGGAVNGSLWSLFPETLCYLAVPLICVVPPWGRGALLLAVMGACGAGGLYMFAYNPTGYGLIYSADPKYVLAQVPFFMAGAFWRELQLRLPGLFRLDAAMLFTAATFLLPDEIGASSVPFRWLTLSYMVLAFGCQSTPVLRQATRFGDLSYGAYLYAFPIQQLVLDHVRGFAITIATAATLAAAMLSWHLIERPALQLKPRSGFRPEAQLGLSSTVAGSLRGGLVRRPDWRRALRRAGRLLGDTPLLPGVVAGVCLGAYAGQLVLGRWQLDEYLMFTGLRVEGWRAVLPRLAYSPRPFSEALLFLYGTAVLAAGNPLIVPFLAALWTGLVGWGIWAARSVLPADRWRTVTAAVLVVALLVFALVTGPVTEMFYWPVAAAAYLPTAGSAMVLMFLLSGPLDARGRAGCCVALLVAAASSEVGAAMAIGFAGAAALSGLREARLVPVLRAGRWWLGPGLLGSAVLLLVATGRGHGVRPGAEHARFAGHFVMSLTGGLREFLREMAGTRGFVPLERLLFAVGFAAVWRRARPVQAAGALRWHAMLAVALAVAGLFSIVAAYNHYGTLCCERHAATRSWFIDVIAILAAFWVLGRWQSWHRAGWLAPAALALAMFPVLFRAGGLRDDYAAAKWATSARARTWQSARTPGGGPMEFYMPPDSATMLVHGYSQPVGTFTVGDAAPEQVAAIGRFFGQAVVVTCQPWQTAESWLIGGVFIPACPPHPGPPDRVLP